MAKGTRLRQVVRHFLETGDWLYDVWHLPAQFKEKVTPINREPRPIWLPEPTPPKEPEPPPKPMKRVIKIQAPSGGVYTGTIEEQE